MYYKIPLQDELNYGLNFSLKINKQMRMIKLMIRYHDILNQWRMSIYDTANHVCHIESIPLLNSAYSGGNLLEPFSYLGLGEAYILPTVEAPSSEHPRLHNLLSEFALIWGDGTNE